MRKRQYSLLLLSGLFVAGGIVFPAHAGLFSVSEADEVAIGREAVREVESKVQLVRKPHVQSYVSRLGRELARSSARPNLPWRFRVIRDEQINAFALPGGFIYIHSKVLETVNSEAELASVLAHEIGHIEGYHHRSRIEKAMKYQLGLGVLGAVLGGGGGADYAMIAGNLLAQGQLTRYSRAAEADADSRSVNLLYRNNFDPMATSRFLAQLVKLERGRSGLLSSFFADHPDAATRVKVTRKQAATLPKRNWRKDSYDFRMISGLGVHNRPHYRGERIPDRRGRGGYSGQQREGARIVPRGY